MDELKDKLSKVSEVYGNQTIIRAAINAVPYVGSTLDVLLSAVGQKYVQRRIETFIKELGEQISLLDASKVNKDFLETEEGFDLIIKAFNSAAKTKQKEKLKLFAKIIKSSLTIGNEYYEEAPELYLRIVDELSVKELDFGMILFKSDLATNIKGMKYNAWDLAKKHPHFTGEELTYILMRLSRAGLLSEFTLTSLNNVSNAYSISEFFQQFTRFMGDLQ